MCSSISGGTITRNDDPPSCSCLPHYYEKGTEHCDECGYPCDLCSGSKYNCDSKTNFLNYI